MKIASYIGDLLYEHECIVIPGLGGFISNDKHSSINDENNTISPPGKNIAFNSHLQLNDGLLLNQIAKRENISHNKARIKLESFVRKCQNALQSGKRIHFHKIGILQKENGGDFIFEADQSYNYQADSFGLTKLMSPPIKRESGIKFNKKFRDRKPSGKNKKGLGENAKSSDKKDAPKYVTINFFWLFIVLGVFAVMYLRFDLIKDFYNNYSQTVPFFYTTPSDYLAENYKYNNSIQQLLPDQEKTSGSAKASEIKKTTKTGFGFSLNDFSFSNKQSEYSDSSIEEKKNEPSSPNEPWSDKAEKSTEDINGSLLSDQPGNEPGQSNTETDKDSSTGAVITMEKNEEVNENESGQQHQDQATSIEEATIPENQKYYIIAGSFMNLRNANKLVNELNNKGFNSSVIGQNKYGDHRVCYEGFASLNDAQKKLAYIRKNFNPSAWLYINK